MQFISKEAKLKIRHNVRHNRTEVGNERENLELN